MRIESLPAQFIPFKEIVIFSNRFIKGKALFSIGGYIPLLVGYGKKSPRVWITIPSDSSGTLWQPLIRDNISLNKQIRVLVKGSMTSVATPEGKVLLIEKIDNDTAKVGYIDLRPFGLAIYGEGEQLFIQKNKLSSNVFSGAEVMVGIGKTSIIQLSSELEKAKQYVERRKQISKVNPIVHSPDLANSLTILANKFASVGQREEGLDAITQAIEIYERLAATNPDAFQPELAASLNNLGAFYSELGRYEEAVEVAKRAAQIYERLAAANPDAFEPDLAMSLSNLGSRLTYVRRREEALEVAKRALAIRERLAAANPDAFAPELASSLNNLGSTYSKLGRLEEALEAAKRAVEIYERLAAANPDAFEPDLAMSLGAMGSIYRELSKNMEAQKSFEKGIAVLKRAFTNHPGAVSSLMNNLFKDYIRMSERIGKDPDKMLLEPILNELKNNH
jgi:tetratricopeptide (TPR) repeat protein